MLRRCLKHIGKKLFTAWDTIQKAVVSDIKAAVNTFAAAGDRCKQLLTQIKLLRAGFASGHIQLQTFCLNTLIFCRYSVKLSSEFFFGIR